MDEHASDNRAEIQPNSKPYLVKRLIADGFDTVLIFCLFMLAMFVIMRSPLASAYNGHLENYLEIEERTKRAFGDNAAEITSALNADREYLDERFAAELHGYLLKGLAGFAAMLPVLLAFPLMNRQRATPGKLMTGVMPFHERRRRSALWYQVLYRFLFVFVVDGLGLYLLTGIWTFVLVPVIRLIELLLSRKDKTVLDMLTGVMMIEKLSYNGIEKI